MSITLPRCTPRQDASILGIDITDEEAVVTRV
jgi:hypothetical protein